jgi:predicted amidohydrolase YtcJ
MILQNSSQAEAGTIPYGQLPLGLRLFVDFPSGHFKRSLTISQADLDADSVVRGRPVVLQSKDCHALWVSSKIIESSLPLPEAVEGGLVLRDDAGRPTGELCQF